MDDPANFLKTYLQRITRGDVAAVREHFDPRAGLFFVQDQDLIPVSFGELTALVESWRTDAPHDPRIEVFKLHEGLAFAVLIARFGEPHGVRFGAVFNLYRSSDGWRIWAANGRTDYKFEEDQG